MSCHTLCVPRMRANAAHRCKFTFPVKNDISRGTEKMGNFVHKWTAQVKCQDNCRQVCNNVWSAAYAWQQWRWLSRTAQNLLDWLRSADCDFFTQPLRTLHSMSSGSPPAQVTTIYVNYVHMSTQHWIELNTRTHTRAQRWCVDYNPPKLSILFWLIHRVCKFKETGNFTCESMALLSRMRHSKHGRSTRNLKLL